MTADVRGTTTLSEPGATFGMAEAVTAAVRERVRQDRKWGTDFPGRPHTHWLAILAEEVGEAAKAVCKLEVPDGEGGVDIDDLETEVIQIAAVALSWLEHGDWRGDDDA